MNKQENIEELYNDNSEETVCETNAGARNTIRRNSKSYERYEKCLSDRNRWSSKKDD